MPTETNVYSRNLKVISIFFIVYWIVGAHPKDDEVALGPVRFVVDNAHLLPWIANSLLVYFAWRFYINSPKKIRLSYRKHFRDLMMFNKSPFWCKQIAKAAKKDFETNGKLETLKRNNPDGIIQRSSADKFNLILPSLQTSSTPTIFTYSYDARVKDSTGNKTALVKNTFQFKFSKLKKAIMHSHLFALWAFKNEDSADYLLPWALFAVAIISIFLRHDTHRNLPIILSTCCLQIA